MGAKKGKGAETTSSQQATDSEAPSVDLRQVPAAPLRGLQWHLDALDMDPLWTEKNRVTHAGMAVVAVLDTGIAYEDYDDASGQYALGSDLSAVNSTPATTSSTTTPTPTTTTSTAPTWPTSSRDSAWPTAWT